MNERRAYMNQKKYDYDVAVAKAGAAHHEPSTLFRPETERFPSAEASFETNQKFARIQQLEKGLRQYKDVEGVMPPQQRYNVNIDRLHTHDYPTEDAYYTDRLKVINDIYDYYGYDLKKPEIKEVLPEKGLYDDPGSQIEFADYDKTLDEGEGLERADVVDPAEANLFLNTGREAREQQKMWSDFSKVQPGHSLGSLAYNGLRRQNLRHDIARFSKATKARNHAYHVDTLHELERKAPLANQPMFVPIYQNDYGTVQFEDDTAKSNYVMGNHLTNEELYTRKWGEYEQAGNIYMPEATLMRYKPRGVRIPELRNRGYDFGLKNEKPSRQQNNLISDDKTMYKDLRPLMRNDDFQRNGRPVKAVNNIDRFNQRVVSSRR